MSEKPENDLKKIPGVGKIIEQDLIGLGYTAINQLKGQDPEEMYIRGLRVKRIQCR